MQIALAWFYRGDSATYFHNGRIAGFSTFASFNPAGELCRGDSPESRVISPQLSRSIVDQVSGSG